MLQMRTVLGDVSANLTKIEAVAQNAAYGGANLLIVPELALTGYGAGGAHLTFAESANGTSMTALGGMARREGIAIVAGFSELEGAVCYNSVLFTTGFGTDVIYRKTNLYAQYEQAWFEPAPLSSIIVEHGGVKIGFLICYDVEFSENVRRLALAGAELIVVPTALPAGPSADFILEHMIKVRAFENQVHIAYTNNVGTSGDFQFAGRSQIVNPDGEILAEATVDDEMLIFATINPLAFKNSILGNTYLQDFRKA
jgi:5-aminopentanamidase